MLFLFFAALMVVFYSDEMPAYLGVMVVPYVCFFLFFLLWVSRHPPKAIRYAAYRAPLVFLVFQIAYLGLEYYHGASLAKGIVGLSGVVVIISFYVIIIGYLYVLLMEQGYLSYLFYMRHHHLALSRYKKKSAAKSRQADNQV